MPLYEYYCEKCKKVFDLMQKMCDRSEGVCPNCGELSTRRLVSASNFTLKGNGWYASDYGSKATPPESESEVAAPSEPNYFNEV